MELGAHAFFHQCGIGRSAARRYRRYSAGVLKFMVAPCKPAAIWRHSRSGILAIMALAALRAGDLEPCLRQVEFGLLHVLFAYFRAGDPVNSMSASLNP